MRRNLGSILSVLLLSVLSPACGDDNSSGMMQPDQPDAGTPGADAANPGAFSTLVSADWRMPAGEEGYWCARVTVPEDTYITEFRPIAPQGTHHTALSVDLAGGQDGVFPCQASTIGFEILFGSGVGTESFALPEGVAFKVAAGKQVLLNLHLYNYGEGELTGTSGIEIRKANPADIQYQAETVYVTNFDLEVPSGASTHEVSCQMNGDVTVFGVFPHMHKLGTHMRGWAVKEDGGEVVLHDQDYTFEEQLDWRVEPAVSLKRGDMVRGICTFENPGGPVSFGDSTDAEMCVLGLYRYPAVGGLSLCLN